MLGSKGWWGFHRLAGGPCASATDYTKHDIVAYASINRRSDNDGASDR